MEVAVYLLLGLAVAGALIYALMQVNARQQRLHAELTRLERLTAEVTMNAEALLDQVDERIERLQQLAAVIEERAKASLANPLPVPAAEPAPALVQAPTSAEAQAPAEGAPSMAVASPPPAEPASEATPAEAKPGGRYDHLRQSAFAMADQGKSPLEIAEALLIPRGEVQLMLNLRGRKVSSR